MRKPLFLIGMMGCGKTTMGMLLAPMLGTQLLDLDTEIERFEGKTIPEIFAASGDPGFRLCETAALRRACAGAPCVVATGGGIITREENITLMRESGLVVWLNRPLERMIADVTQDYRPNLAGDKTERMRTLFAQREALYRKAAHIDYAENLPPQEAAQKLVTLICDKI